MNNSRDNRYFSPDPAQQRLALARTRSSLNCRLFARTACDWVAGLVVRHIVDGADGTEMVRALSYDLAIRGYNL